MPLPLAMMIPFMGIQSAVMAKQFGENFQYGKRRISAMSNEEFNKLTPQKIQENANAELKAMIPSMQASVEDMKEFQKFLIHKFVEMMEDVLNSGLGALLGFDQGIIEKIHEALGHPGHSHGGQPPVPPVPPAGGGGGYYPWQPPPGDPPVPPYEPPVPPVPPKDDEPKSGTLFVTLKIMRFSSGHNYYEFEGQMTYNELENMLAIYEKWVAGAGLRFSASIKSRAYFSITMIKRQMLKFF